MSKTKQTQTKSGTTTGTQSGSNTTSWGYEPGAESADINKLRDHKFEVDPNLKYQYADLKRRYAGSFNNPTGAAYNPSVKDAMLRSGEERLGQDEAQAYRGGQYDVNKLDFARNSVVAGITKPQFVQKGSKFEGTNSGTSSGTGTSETGKNAWGNVLDVASAAGPAAASM